MTIFFCSRVLSPSRHFSSIILLNYNTTHLFLELSLKNHTMSAPSRGAISQEQATQIEKLAESKLGMDRDQVLKTPIWKLVKQLQQQGILKPPSSSSSSSFEKKRSPKPRSSEPEPPSEYPLTKQRIRPEKPPNTSSSVGKELIKLDRELRHVKEMKVPNIKDDTIGYIVNLFAEYKHVRSQASKEYNGLQLLEEDPDFGPSDIAYAQKEMMGNTVKLEELRAQIIAAIASYGKFVERRNHKEKLLAETGQFPVSMIEHWNRQKAIRENNMKMFQKQFVPFLKSSTSA